MTAGTHQTGSTRPGIRLDGRSALGAGAELLSGPSESVLRGRDNLKKLSSELSGPTRELAEKFIELTSKFDRNIKHALRVAFIQELRTAQRLEGVEGSARQPDLAPEQLTSAITSIGHLAIASPSKFQLNVECHKFTLAGKKTDAWSSLSDGDRQAVLRILKDLSESFSARKDALSETIRAQLAGTSARYLPDATTVSNERVELPSRLEQPEFCAKRAFVVALESNVPSIADGLAQELKNIFISTGALTFHGKANKLIDGIGPGGTPPDFRTFASIQLADSPVCPPWNSCETLRISLFTAVQALGEPGRSFNQLRLPRGLVTFEQGAAPQDARSIVQKLNPFSRTEAPSEFGSLHISIIPPSAIEECGPNYQRTDARLFMVTVSVAARKSDLASMIALLAEAKSSRGAVLSLVDSASSYPSGVRDVVEKLRSGIFEPLARHLHGLGPDKKWWELSEVQKRAVVGWFDCLDVTGPSQRSVLQKHLAAQLPT